VPAADRPAIRAWIVHTASVPTQAELLDLADQVFVRNYRQHPIVLERGRGCESGTRPARATST
jgi:hypothetical protein